MTYSGTLLKMQTHIEEPITYKLKLGEETVAMNEFLGSPISLRFDGRISCVSCGKRTNKAFGQGFCYSCFANAPENSECILRPELCEGHLGGGRDPEWEQQHHVQPHVVYLALSSGLKVGITRATQVPTRWIDQGAEQAIILAETPHRRLAGEIEVFLKAHYSDRTNWQQMLKGQVAHEDLLSRKQEAKGFLPEELAEYVSDSTHIHQMHYPLIDTPQKVKSLKLDKEPLIEGILTGIKAQYLILDNNLVINVRSHSGYHIELNV